MPAVYPHTWPQMMWLNGELVERGQLDADSAGVMLGWGVFTTLGVRAGEARFVARHFARLERDARAAEVPLAWSFNDIEHGLGEVLRSRDIKNGLARLTLTRRGDGRWNGDGGADLSIQTLETALPPTELRVGLSPFRVEAKRPLCGVKTTAYLPYLWAWQQARRSGYDEAILRDGRDFLSEGARASLFWMQDGALHTPSLQCGCLAGIGRDLTLEWAQKNGLEARQGRFTASEIESASEIWLVSAATGPRPVASWHDENGELRASFSGAGPLCGEFARWFEAQTE